MSTQSEPKVEKHVGSCHCGKVKFAAYADLSFVTRCNCSICQKTAQVASSIKPDAFEIVAGESELGAYVWGSQVGTRYFCKRCGVHCFGKGHLAELGGDFVSVNVNCLDDVDVGQMAIMHWDGRHDNWQAGPRPTAWPVFT